ncbi:MAG: LysR family transcriptional regulator [Clostridium sp.]|nr:LysR family transcriptional regulator [uncultured Intestinibacter sp.]DAE58955.1 MAG TPA: replisome organizer protein [Caudoviricetes sp.]
MQESSDLGWIKLYRSLLYSDVFQNEKMLKVFIWCLLKSGHKDKQIRIGKKLVNVKRGQFVFGRAKAAEELGLSQSTVWSYMKELEERKTIKIKSNNKFSLVSIENWASYQVDEEIYNNKITTKRQQNNNKATTNEQQKDTNKNVKNVKNIYAQKIDDLWLLYPNKKGKKTAYKKIESLLGEYSFEELKRCVQRYSREIQGVEKQFIKHGSTFFTSGYIDYLDANYEESHISHSSSWMDNIESL